MRYKVEYPFTKIFAPEKKRCVPAVSTMSSAQEKLDTSSAYQSSQKQFSKPVFLWNYKTNSGVFSKKANGLYYKPFWFFDKAAPIPGVSFLKKAKVLYSLK
jgi:hypothetical protein